MSKNVASIASIKREFLRGNHVLVAETFDRHPALLKKAGLLPLAIGSWVFVGELEKAEVAFARAEVSVAIQAAARFFLAIGRVRRSDYAKARALLASNARIPRASRTPLVQFYVQQGFAFYRFFCGRYELAQKHAQKAYEAALERGFVYGEILSLDLLGHAAVNAGSVRLGLKHLEAAVSLAEKVGNGGLASALRVTLLKMRAQFGLEPQASLEKLQKALEDQRAEDTYSRAEIYLELSRQLILRGRLDRARELLDESCDFIYKNQNRRQAATLNLRYAHLMHLEGRHHQAIHLLRTAETALVPEVDLLQVAQLKGLRAAIERKIGRLAPAASASASEHRLSNGIHSRIQSRFSGSELLVRRGEDPLGDLIDQVKAKDETCLAAIVEQGYFGLLRDFFDLGGDTRALIFDLVPGSVTVIGDGTVRYQDKGMNGILRKLVRLMQTRAVGKEEMIREVWGYEYDPARHDSLAYSAITKLRKLMEPFGSWIEYGEDGYRLREGTQVIFTSFESIKGKVSDLQQHQVGQVARDGQVGQLGQTLVERFGFEAKPESVPSERQTAAAVTNGHQWTETNSNLNFRQIEILRHLEKQKAPGMKSMNVAECAKLFSTSKITACRDLSLLNELGHCRRVGKGRATRYVLTQTSARAGELR